MGLRRSPSPRPEAPRLPPAVIRINRMSEYADLLHWSPHVISHDDRGYPTASHLYEAAKFLPQYPEVAEAVRNAATCEEAVAFGERYREYWRPDWPKIQMSILEDILLTKFFQYDDLRALLFSTGNADLVFFDEDVVFGDGLIGQGQNNLGRALMVVRQRLRAEFVNEARAADEQLGHVPH
ncbi:uncharacterized protein BXZ73DRAFT_43829 [Epithele typhae]|uniref:uncharacterized protein n=1 Tax=Epithele typhae TaxID=378194 RepID=UPI0020087A21|nr:uncharacterized protein BXZ73DRAFT_43829 [Epithele typhae]KAH9939330.1 hypothetical protein BXZ73DRAFT_43829 [Epithele typhae]